MSQMTRRSMIRDGLTMRHGGGTDLVTGAGGKHPDATKPACRRQHRGRGAGIGPGSGLPDDLPSCKAPIESTCLTPHLQTASGGVTDAKSGRVRYRSYVEMDSRVRAPIPLPDPGGSASVTRAAHDRGSFPATLTARRFYDAYISGWTPVLGDDPRQRRGHACDVHRRA